MVLKKVPRQAVRRPARSVPSLAALWGRRQAPSMAFLEFNQLLLQVGARPPVRAGPLLDQLIPRERSKGQTHNALSLSPGLIRRGALVPIGVVFAILWILVFYWVIVRVSHLNWPNPVDWLPPDWVRFLPRWLR